MAKPSPMDMAMHGVRGSNPDTVLRIGVVLRVAGKPDDLRRRLTARLAEHLPSLPVLRHVITGSGGRRRWSPRDLDFDVHIVEHQLDPGTRMIDALQWVLRIPFPADAPPWDFHILSGYRDDEYGVFFRVHHSLLDGSGLVYLLEKLFHPNVLPDHAYSAMAGWRTATGTSARDLAAAGKLLARNAARTDFWRKAGYSPSARRCFRWASVPTSSLRTVARAHHTTTNDIYLAAYVSAFRSWADTHAPGLVDQDVGMIVPVNTRRIQQLSAPGNYTAAARIALPAGASSTAELIAAVSRATMPVKSQSVRHALAVLTSHTPMPVHSALWRVLLTPSRATPVASNVVVRHALEFDGDPVLTITPLMPLPERFPCTAVLVSYRDTATICVTSDDALPGMQDLHERWRRTIAEMAGEAAGGNDSSEEPHASSYRLGSSLRKQDQP